MRLAPLVAVLMIGAALPALAQTTGPAGPPITAGGAPARRL